MQFAGCPLCRGINIVHPGDPPSKGYNFYNRCCNAALTGRGSANGRRPVKGSGLCGFPLTTDSGAIRPSIPTMAYRAITQQQRFDTQALWKLAISLCP